METRFSRIHSAKDIVISSVLFAAGIICIVVPASVPVNIVGYTLAIVGLVLFFVMKTAFKDAESGETLKKTEKYFPASKSRRQDMSSPSCLNISLTNTSLALRYSHTTYRKHRSS